MKQRFTLTFCYTIYLGTAIFLNPAKGNISFTDNSNLRMEKKMETAIAQEKAEILHSGLLFKF